MDFEDFRKEFIEEVRADAIVSGIGSVASFVQTASAYMLNADVFPDAITPAFFEGEGKRNRKLRIDGYLFDPADNTMNLFIADYDSVERNNPMIKTLAQGLFKKIEYFIDEAYGQNLRNEIEPSIPVADLVDELYTQKADIAKFRFVILTTRQNIEIDFKSYTPNGIPCIEATGMEDNGFKSYLCIIPGETLAQIYDDIGSQLLEGNVRSFLSTKVAVNKKIRETILREPGKFFAYNNGVATTAMNLKIENNGSGLFITYAEDFQIINGGQTTASLSSAKRKDHADLSGIYVQMKLTEIDSESDQAADLIRNISRSSNSQNKVSDADFFSTHPFHVRMEQISRHLFAPAVNGQQFETLWFYERARGQYLQKQMFMTKSEKDKFKAQNPKQQLVTKTDFAKARNSWDKLPHVVSKGAQTNFLKFAEIINEGWDKNPDIYNEKYFKDTMAIIKLFKELEELVPNQPWYEQGYRANIVTYSIALFNFLIEKKSNNQCFDLSVIWNKQKIPNQVLEEFMKITEFVNAQITDPARETVNVTQWCKRDNCWKKMQEAALRETDLLDIDNIEMFFVSKEDERSEAKQAKNKQHEISDMRAQKAVLDYPASFWCQLEEFILTKRLGSPDMRKALWPAKRIPTKIPTPFQAKRLLELLDIALAEGFKSTIENGDI